MEYMGTERMQLGKSGFFTDNLSNILSGAMTVSIYECPQCGKLELFRFKKTKRK
jgi:hypothetical protein